MKNIKWIYLIVVLFFVYSCKQDKPDNKTISEVETKTIKLLAQDRPGGEPYEFDMPIHKGLDKLEFTDPNNVKIDSNELVIGIALDETRLAIPLTYLSGFEVANLFLDSNNYLITWCPLVGSARIFEGNIDGDNSGFDFGRGLKNNNLLIVDRKTNSVWNQLSYKAIQGDLQGDSLVPLPSIQSTWGFWKEKYPDTKLLVNKDTTEAVFPTEVFQKQYYNTWKPGEEYPEDNKVHQIENLGIGIELGPSIIYFPFEKLFDTNSPLEYKIKDQNIFIHFEKSGITAWAENSEGEMIPSTIAYDWAWKSFFPKTKTFEN